jgi:hypothetical protein
MEKIANVAHSRICAEITQQLLFEFTISIVTPKRLENSQIMTNSLGFPVQVQVRFERLSLRPNAEPNLVFRYLLNLSLNAVSGSDSVQVRIDFRTEPCHHSPIHDSVAITQLLSTQSRVKMRREPGVEKT